MYVGKYVCMLVGVYVESSSQNSFVNEVPERCDAKTSLVRMGF